MFSLRRSSYDWGACAATGGEGRSFETFVGEGDAITPPFQAWECSVTRSSRRSGRARMASCTRCVPLVSLVADERSAMVRLFGSILFPSKMCRLRRSRQKLLIIEPAVYSCFESLMILAQKCEVLPSLFDSPHGRTFHLSVSPCMCAERAITALRVGENGAMLSCTSAASRTACRETAFLCDTYRLCAVHVQYRQ